MSFIKFEVFHQAMLQSLGKASRRKIRVTIGLTLLLITSLFLIYLGAMVPIWYFLLAGLFGLTVFVMGIPIVKAKEAFVGMHLMQIDSKHTIYFNQLIQIDEIGANWLYRHIIWSVAENKTYRSIGWNFFKITFEENSQIQTAFILVDPKKKNIFKQYLLTAKKSNSFFHLNTTGYLV